MIFLGNIDNVQKGIIVFVDVLDSRGILSFDLPRPSSKVNGLNAYNYTILLCKSQYVGNYLLAKVCAL